MPLPDVDETGFIEAFASRYPRCILECLLADRTTGRNIIWADSEYADLGDGYGGDDEITVEKITGQMSGLIKPRVAKELELQSSRTRSRAEVFTPSWLVSSMNNALDEDWFGRDGVFNVEEGNGWKANRKRMAFPKAEDRGWRDYISSTRLEITCGEAPFICSRYDTVTGEILAVADRIGLLDRKLRVVSERARTRDTWVKWAMVALQSTYGYEYQGDNLLIARINVFETVEEHLRERWSSELAEEEMVEVAGIISWNIWQMDGLTCAPPTNAGEVVYRSMFEEAEPEGRQVSLFEGLDGFDEYGGLDQSSDCVILPLCIIYDWEKGEQFEFAALKGGTSMEKKFYAVVGNPPYQAEKDNNGRQPPIYNYFMDEAYRIADRVELVTPARFLFGAGQTPKEWNRKMLADEHLKVMRYEADSSKVFPNTLIRGGVAVTLRDETRKFGPIGVFAPYAELNQIISKVKPTMAMGSIADEVTGAVPYRFSEKLRQEKPELLSKVGKSFDLRTNVLDNLYNLLFFKEPLADVDCAAIFGLLDRQREFLWVDRSYIDVPDNYSAYKVLLPKASGGGEFGEKLGALTVVDKGVGHTQSFVSIGKFETRGEAEALAKYLKTKFARTLLGVLKVTQDITPRVWRLVPLQDFTSASDIDWSKPIADIDRQLYAKYGLDDSEIEFIETHVKEMG